MFKPNKPDRPAGFRPILARLALLPLCALAAQAQAVQVEENKWDTCVRATGNVPIYNQYWPATTVHIGNNAAVGDFVGPWITGGMLAAWKCTRNKGSVYPPYPYDKLPVEMSVQSKLVYVGLQAPLPVFVQHEGQQYRVSRFSFDAASTALAYIARWRATIDGVTTDWTPLTSMQGVLQPANSTVTVTKNVGDVYYIQTETQMRFIKRTNALVPGYQHSIVDPVYAYHHQQVGAQWSIGSGSYYLIQVPQKRITFTGGGTCTTSSVPDPVTLPIVVAGDFSGQGSTLGTTSFDLKLESCPAGLYSIGYYFTPATTILDAANGVIALDGSSSATGVGLQLTEDNNTPLKFGEPNTYPLTAYDPSSVNTYTVPLKVAYYQTGSTPVGSGSVSSSMTVTLKYQ